MSLPGITGMHGLVGAVGGATGGGGNPDANTLWLFRYNVSPPTEEIGGLTLTLSGDAAVDTTNHWMTCDGTGDWASASGITGCNIPAGDFTLEIHMKTAAAAAGGSIARRAGINPGSWGLFHNGDGTIDAYFDNVSASPLLNFGAGAADNTMKHFAIVRSGNTWTSYVQGVQKATTTNSGTIGTALATFTIGSDAFNLTARDLAGTFARAKCSNVARWTSSFTPPSLTDV